MSEVVFLSNTNIQIATGSATGSGVKVGKLLSAPLPEGAVLNGVVVDPDIVIDAISTLWNTNKLPKTDVTLIINSPQLRAYRIDAPILSDKKTTAYIERETADSDYGRFQNPATGWYLLSKDNKAKMQKVVYERAESDFIKNYEDIFDKAGLKLKAIHNGVQLATEYFSRQIAGRTLIYMILDGKSLVTVFFAEGKYYYDSTSRVFSQPETPEFAREIYASISSIRQFMSAQRLNVDLHDIFFAGLTQAQVNRLANDIVNIDSQIDISVVTPPQGTSISGGDSQFPFYVYPVAALRKPNERLSILKDSKQAKARSKESKGFVRLIAAAVAIFLVAVLIYVGLAVYKATKEAELKRLNDYNRSPEVIAKSVEYDAMYDNMEEIGAIQGGADLLREYINSYPAPDSSINEKIVGASGPYDVNIVFNSYSASTGIFNITASSPTVDDINKFIADLMELDIFESVDYTGYAISSDGSRYQINVVCTLAAGDLSGEEEVN